jgi:hypothetical protein
MVCTNQQEKKTELLLVCVNERLALILMPHNTNNGITAKKRRTPKIKHFAN